MTAKARRSRKQPPSSFLEDNGTLSQSLGQLQLTEVLVRSFSTSHSRQRALARVGGTITPVWTEEANARMEPLRDEARALLDDGMVLAPELQQLTAAGITAVDGRLYFRQYLAARDGNRDRFDRTGHESWVNTLHLDDVVDEHASDWGARCVAQGMLLSRVRLIGRARCLRG